jgi:hypothetical protein
VLVVSPRSTVFRKNEDDEEEELVRQAVPIGNRNASRLNPFELDGGMIDSKARFQLAAHCCKKFIIAYQPRFN